LGFIVGAGTALALCAATAYAAPFDSASDKLRWAPPPLDHPITIKLGDGQTYNKLQDDRDYIVKLPPTKKVGSTILEGGHNIVIIGGHITLPVTDDKSNGAMSRGIYIKNNLGTVHIEGVLIDGSGGGMSDGIDIAAPQSTVQVENVRVEGIYGYLDQFHADVIQPFGGVKDLRVDKLTGYSAYQGLTIDRDLGDIGSAELSRVNLVATGDQIWGSHNNGGYMLWLTRDSGCKVIFPVRLHQVWIQPRKNTPLANAVWPPVGGRTACPVQAKPDDSEARFPSLPVAGRVRKGMPPGGDFVPPGVAGLNYVSPGYRSEPGDFED
jgi:hypothetical protein